MSKLDKGQTKSRQLVTLIKYLSGLPGLGFLSQYADTIHKTTERVQNTRGAIAKKQDDMGDARDAWDNFSGKK